jgi:hypothetical protein
VAAVDDDRLPVPGQPQFGDLAGWMVGDTGEQIGEIVLRVEVIELGLRWLAGLTFLRVRFGAGDRSSASRLRASPRR